MDQSSTDSIDYHIVDKVSMNYGVISSCFLSDIWHLFLDIKCGKPPKSTLDLIRWCRHLNRTHSRYPAHLPLINMILFAPANRFAFWCTTTIHLKAFGWYSHIDVVSRHISDPIFWHDSTKQRLRNMVGRWYHWTQQCLESMWLWFHYLMTIGRCCLRRQHHGVVKRGAPRWFLSGAPVGISRLMDLGGVQSRCVDGWWLMDRLGISIYLLYIRERYFTFRYTYVRLSRQHL